MLQKCASDAYTKVVAPLVAGAMQTSVVRELANAWELKWLPWELDLFSWIKIGVVCGRRRPTQVENGRGKEGGIR